MTFTVLHRLHIESATIPVNWTIHFNYQANISKSEGGGGSVTVPLSRHGPEVDDVATEQLDEDGFTT